MHDTYAVHCILFEVTNFCCDEAESWFEILENVSLFHQEATNLCVSSNYIGRPEKYRKYSALSFYIYCKDTVSTGQKYNKPSKINVFILDPFKS
jgi:hypothetical protein